MRHLLTLSLLCTSLLATGCSVQVKEQPEPIVKRDRKIDINVDAPGVDVKVKRNK